MLIKPKNPDISAEEALAIAMQKLNEQAQYIDKLEKALPNFRFSTLEEGVTDYVQNYLLQNLGLGVF